MLPLSTQTAEHYLWGDPANPSEGWHLLRTPTLSVIQERMPPSSAEHRHTHARAHQFFYVLSGTLTLELTGTRHTLTAGQTLQVPPTLPHQAFNLSAEDVHFLVTSQPPSHGDRFDA